MWPSSWARVWDAIGSFQGTILSAHIQGVEGVVGHEGRRIGTELDAEGGKVGIDLIHQLVDAGLVDVGGSAARGSLEDDPVQLHEFNRLGCGRDVGIAVDGLVAGHGDGTIGHGPAVLVLDDVGRRGGKAARVVLGLVVVGVGGFLFAWVVGVVWFGGQYEFYLEPLRREQASILAQWEVA